MTRRLLLASALVAACSGSNSEVPTKESSPTTPSGSSTSSSGGGSSSGGSSSGGSTTSSSGSSSGGAAQPDAGADAASDENCVPKSYKGNEKKIGAYCDDDVSCPFNLDPFLVCTKPYDPTGNHMFCTAACSSDAECGSGAYCVKDPQGNGCVPTQCGGAPSP